MTKYCSHWWPKKGLIFGHLTYGDWKWVLVTIKKNWSLNDDQIFSVVGDGIWKKWACNNFWKALNELYTLWPKITKNLVSSDKMQSLATSKGFQLWKCWRLKFFGHLMYGVRKWVVITIRESLIIGWWMKFFGHGQLNFEKGTWNMYLESFQQALHLVMDGNQKFNHKWKKK